MSTVEALVHGAGVRQDDAGVFNRLSRVLEARPHRRRRHAVTVPAPLNQTAVPTLYNR